MPPKHIVISINAAWNIYNFRRGLIKALLAHGHRVTALAPSDEFAQRLTDMGCDFYALEMDNKGTSPLRDFLLYRRYLRALRELKPDAFLGYTIKPNIYGSMAAHKLGIEVINNVSGLGTSFIRKTLLTRIVTSLYRTALRKSVRVFFQNRDDRTVFTDLKIVDPSKTALLPGSGINLTEYQPAERNRSWDPTKPVFLLVARLVRDKGVAEYVDAAQRVRRELPDARMQILGFLDVENRTAVSRSQMDDWVRDGAVEYLGNTDDVMPYIAAADCVVLPSYREGTPRSLLEAAALARPLITTDVPGCREVVEDGVNGFLCRVRDADSLAKAMLKLAQLGANEYQHMATQSRALVENKFDEQIVIGAYAEALGLNIEAREKA